MPRRRKRGKSFKKRIKLNHILIIFFLSFLFVLIYFNAISTEKISQEIQTCGDGTVRNTCSVRKPYFCDNGILVEKSSVCGCNEILDKSGESCISQYHTNSKEVTLNYVLRGEEREINFTVYRGMEDYLSTVSRVIYYEGDEEPSRADFKLKSINEEEQREFLLPLVTEIQGITNDKEDQVRIAISLVQHIPYGSSGKTIFLGDGSVNYSRYPYEVLYENEVTLQKQLLNLEQISEYMKRAPDQEKSMQSGWFLLTMNQKDYHGTNFQQKTELLTAQKKICFWQ